MDFRSMMSAFGTETVLADLFESFGNSSSQLWIARGLGWSRGRGQTGGECDFFVRLHICGRGKRNGQVAVAFAAGSVG